MDVNIEKADWEILAGMGSGAEEGLQAAGIDDFDEAVEACAVLQDANAASGAEYKLDDLICFLCLSQHKEAVSDPAAMPAFAHPVSIEEDLGLDPLSPPRALQECPAAFPALGDSAVQPLKKKARRWRANTLLQPLAQLARSRHGFITTFVFWREPQVTSRTISCPGSPLPQRFASFNVIAPCMAAEFPLLADSMMANSALQTLSQT